MPPSGCSGRRGLFEDFAQELICESYVRGTDRALRGGNNPLT